MLPVGRVDWTGIPAATAKATLTFFRHFQTPKTTKGRYKSDLSIYSTGGRLNWAGTPDATVKATLTFFRHFQTPKTTKGRYKSDLSMYGTGGRT
ncbi:hypothetical protein GCM10007906_04490 [Vibrio hyugaensis]|uniref:Uncharacterized protein n=1 Tax=Vibrio hyugaensis TaxID=1534743 RepID=A0ABQ5XX42_9VIBR|nr:hypothetical protein GCM10007906_04490 [Vibrio hyugaensis]